MDKKIYFQMMYHIILQDYLLINKLGVIRLWGSVPYIGSGRQLTFSIK